MNKLPKIIVILGPTASGKTKLAIELAKKFNGEIISADSRQIYKQMKIGTDRPDGKTQSNAYVVDKIKHHLMNCIQPNKGFSLADFKKKAESSIKKIIAKGNNVFVAGGTGLYISALVDNFVIPKIKPDNALRSDFERKTTIELAKMLEKIDADSAKLIDMKNRRRLIRALEVATLTGGSFVKQRKKAKPIFNVLLIGILMDRDDIYERINTRVDQQIQMGLFEEVISLLNKGLTWNMPSMSSLGYRQFKPYFNNEQDLGQCIENLKRDTRHYAKRQISWFKRDKKIKWVNSEDRVQVYKMVEDFLS
ncbi:MAG: tRNA (adenosine(37)-N6)-dimethylallyltransferase MiaA [bacterium]